MNRNILLVLILIGLLGLLGLLVHFTGQVTSTNTQVSDTITQVSDTITSAEDSETPPPGMETFKCIKCHLCEIPTRDEPCLPACVRHEVKRFLDEEYSMLEELTESVVIGSTGTLYDPVHFSHIDHASMSLMGDGCSECHHYSPLGDMPPDCETCHNPNVNEISIEMPGLKGAFKRQCTNCHTEWSGSNVCEECHVPKGTTLEEWIRPYKLPRLEPDKEITIVSPFDPNWSVAFGHQTHAFDFGIKCAECHKATTCKDCHNPETDKPKPAWRVAHSSVCFECHDARNCGKCHDNAVNAENFDHSRTGWPLNEHHIKLDCSSCHKATGFEVGGHFSRKLTKCTSCHSNWNMENFDHERLTGFELGETHSLFDCTDCHEDRKYDEEVVCDTCHG